MNEPRLKWPRQEWPRVAIIVLNFNGRKDTLACLASLQELDYPAWEAVVVDNASTDGSVAAIRSTFLRTVIIESGENLGYVGGNNLGLQYAQENGFDYALLLNNDTLVDPKFLRWLVEAIDSNPQAAMAGPTIYYASQPEMVWSAGGAIDRWGGGTHMLGIGETDRGQFGQAPRPVDFVTGCALLIKMPVIEQIGPLDSRFYMYYEESEWCMRAAQQGYQILHVPQAKIWHKISPKAREASPQVHYYMTRNRLLFVKLAQLGFVPWARTLLYDANMLLSWTIKPRWRHKHSQRQATIQALRDYQRGRFGRVDISGGWKQ